MSLVEAVRILQLEERVEILEEQERKFLLLANWVFSQPELEKRFILEVVLEDIKNYPYERVSE